MRNLHRRDDRDHFAIMEKFDQIARKNWMRKLLRKPSSGGPTPVPERKKISLQLLVLSFKFLLRFLAAGRNSLHNQEQL